MAAVGGWPPSGSAQGPGGAQDLAWQVAFRSTRRGRRQRARTTIWRRRPANPPCRGFRVVRVRTAAQPGRTAANVPEVGTSDFDAEARRRGEKQANRYGVPPRFRVSASNWLFSP